jgi:hypothetical protein
MMGRHAVSSAPNWSAADGSVWRGQRRVTRLTGFLIWSRPGSRSGYGDGQVRPTGRGRRAVHVQVLVEVDDGLAVTGVGQDESPRQARREAGAGLGRRLVLVVVVEAPHGDRDEAGDSG